MKKPNVFFIVLDAVRPDNLSCYGHSNLTSPNIDKIADEGVLFKNAFSAAPWSPDSHASMFTGLYPSNHGVLGGNLHLSKEPPSLPQIFNAEGYRTLGICPNMFVSSHFGFHHGFNRFIDESLPFELLKRKISSWLVFSLETDIRALIYRWTYHAIIFEELKNWVIQSRKKNKPFFIFVNYFDAHLPHSPPRPFKQKFLEPNPSVDYKKIDECFNKNFGFPYISKEVEVSDEEWKFVKSLYDAEIAYIDFFIGKTCDYLEKYGLLDETCILVTADHGENFGEHELAGHAFCLYDTLLHIPLIYKSPNCSSPGMKIENIVSTIDIFPTLLSISNVKKMKSVENADKVDGKNLNPPEERQYHDYLLAEYGPPTAQIMTMKRLCPNFDSSIFNKTWRCIRSADFKYIVKSTGEEEWYNLKDDPDEEKNIINEVSEDTKKKLHSIIFKELKVTLMEKKLPPEEEIRRRLQKLGYF